MMNTRIGGIIPLTKDERDLSVGASFTLPPLASIRPLERLIPLALQYDQLDTDTCAGFGTALMRSYQEHVKLQPLFPWVWARSQTRHAIDDFGIDLRSIAKAHQKIGALENEEHTITEPREVWRDITNWNTPKAQIEAILHRAGSYMFIDPMNGMDLFDTIRCALYKFKDSNTLIGFGMRWAYPDSVPIVNAWQEGGFGHFVTAIDFTSDGKYLVIQNSWGKQAGNAGKFYISREVVNKEASIYGAFFFVDETPENIKYFMEKGVSLDTNSLNKWRILVIKKLIELYNKLIVLNEQKKSLMNEQTKNSLYLYEESKRRLGVSLVQAGVDPMFGCASSMNNLNRLAFPKEGEIGGEASTELLLKALIASPHYEEVVEPLYGDIIISATGTSTLKNPVIKNGHVGVVGRWQIMSNNSMTGLWSTYFTMESWRDRYEIRGGYPTRYFRHV